MVYLPPRPDRYPRTDSERLAQEEAMRKADEKLQLKLNLQRQDWAAEAKEPRKCRRCDADIPALGQCWCPKPPWWRQYV